MTRGDRPGPSTNLTRLKIELEAHAELLAALADANARERALVEEIDKWRRYARSLEHELGRGPLTGAAAVVDVPVEAPSHRDKSWSLSDIIDETFDVISRADPSGDDLERETTDPEGLK